MTTRSKFYDWDLESQNQVNRLHIFVCEELSPRKENFLSRRHPIGLSGLRPVSSCVVVVCSSTLLKRAKMKFNPGECVCLRVCVSLPPVCGGVGGGSGRGLQERRAESVVCVRAAVSSSRRKSRKAHFSAPSRSAAAPPSPLSVSCLCPGSVLLAASAHPSYREVGAWECGQRRLGGGGGGGGGGGRGEGQTRWTKRALRAGAAANVASTTCYAVRGRGSFRCLPLTGRDSNCACVCSV